jgi:RNA polymerase sigma factor (sigma-70 family)
MAITAAEQNRLIIDNSSMVAPIAAYYRGRKGIPFDELVAEGMAGLVIAARMWESRSSFVTYATHKINSAISDFVDRWQHLVVVGEDGIRDDEDTYFEWDIWQFAAPYEWWTSLAATPEQLVSSYQEIVSKQSALRNAMLSLKKRDREIVYARFMKNPTQTLESIARDQEISYQRVVFILSRALKLMCEVVNNIEKKPVAA